MNQTKRRKRLARIVSMERVFQRAAFRSMGAAKKMEKERERAYILLMYASRYSEDRRRRTVGWFGALFDNDFRAALQCSPTPRLTYFSVRLFSRIEHHYRRPRRDSGIHFLNGESCLGVYSVLYVHIQVRLTIEMPLDSTECSTWGCATFFLAPT